MRAHRHMPQAPPKRGARSQKGNALVEFALVLPMFLLLVFGMITFSIALYDKTILTIATRDGARAGAIFVGTNTAKELRANTIATAASTSLISFVDSTPVITAVINSGANTITVTATYTYYGLPSPYDGYILPTTMNLTGQTIMIVE